MRGISWLGLLARFVFALALVFATYNPSAYSYYGWVAGELPEYSAFMIFVGIVLLIGWTILLRATLRSLGPFGLLLAIAFFGVLLWLVVDVGLLPADSTQAITYLILLALSGVLATGVSWSHVRRRVSGQADVDDVDEG
ncbi:MAG: DUF6524 family protein [Gammaproteobacteria bacterium]|nr:DUF6524 family protein [Gammaproteobacteria bacterium]